MGREGCHDPPSTAGWGESLLGQRRELISLGSQFSFVCEFVIIINYYYILFLWSVSNSKRQKRMTFLA